MILTERPNFATLLVRVGHRHEIGILLVKRFLKMTLRFSTHGESVNVQYDVHS
jgi:hypothetical protein